jgi:CHAT domain-containing protein
LRALTVSGPRIGHGEREVAEVAGRLARTEVFSGSAATVDRVLGGLARASLAHLAAHGHHAGDNALFSGLELADGTLMGYDIQRLPSVPALVVLSACDVGQSEIAPGDESLGMVTAFVTAGAGTVVAAVCRIGDELAPTMMRAFYDGLVAGHGPAKALADAGAAFGVTGLVCFGAG